MGEMADLDEHNIELYEREEVGWAEEWECPKCKERFSRPAIGPAPRKPVLACRECETECNFLGVGYA